MSSVGTLMFGNAMCARSGRPPRETTAATSGTCVEAISADAAPVLNYLGYMNADREVRVDEAARLIEKAVALDPENGAYLDSLGWAHYRLGKLESAEQNVRKALAKQPNSAVILDHLADVLKQRGRIAEAAELWKKALAGEDDDGELDRAVVDAKVREAQTWLAKNP